MKTIQEMAQEAGLCTWTVPPQNVVETWEAFAALVREDEREACVKALLSIANADAGNPYKQALRMGAEAIRARSNT